MTTERQAPRVRLDHTVVAGSDWDVSNRFYRDVLGADVGANVARIPVQPGNSDLCFVWPGPIEDAVAHLESHGVTIETGPVARHGARDAGTSVYFRDPDGSLLELISYTRR